jgi:excinuclease UvrABC nuclease subunit
MNESEALIKIAELQAELDFYKREYLRLSKAHGRQRKTPVIIGCYLIVSIPRQWAYIGSSKNCIRRWGEHKTTLKRGCHANQAMQVVSKFDGLHNFDFRLIAKTSTVEESRALEKELINHYQPRFNVSKNCQDPQILELPCLIRGGD